MSFPSWYFCYCVIFLRFVRFGNPLRIFRLFLAHMCYNFVSVVHNRKEFYIWGSITPKQVECRVFSRIFMVDKSRHADHFCILHFNLSPVGFETMARKYGKSWKSIFQGAIAPEQVDRFFQNFQGRQNLCWPFWTSVILSYSFILRDNIQNWSLSVCSIFRHSGHFG